MKRSLIAALVAATLLTPAVQAADIAPKLDSAVASVALDNASEYRRGGHDRRRHDGARPEARRDSPHYDRNRDGNLDRRWDRNRDDRLDRRWDRNRDDRLDRRWDRNDDERLDRRHRGSEGYDRNNGWNNDWRRDRRHDWQGYRNHNRSHYNRGRYYAPYRGHHYRRPSIGIQFSSGYFGSRYVISDPYRYRLPSAYGPYRWVRYYNDAVLIDTRTGYAADVVHNFFW